MSSPCISDCIEDVARLPVRPTYVRLYRWPESEAEFLNPNMRRGPGAHPRVVDSVWCRQMYLRSYTFSRKETVLEKTKKSFGKARETVKNKSIRMKTGKGKNGIPCRRKCLVLRRAKEVTCAGLFSIFKRLLACTTKVDVADHQTRT
ncbi:hypothetical protein HS088_TW22G01101 [Tripterygium wilfordii]|uniref:Uncharacterized protein n=1 Tax=Tripterygium wilfordii TaxID=458696 RepID=A0A7J7BZX9_TRIWF|nr:uncharacterized protein LOC119991537 [Tripterygium wilfordii]KAF5727408.1 hypothetical protein HS088_TW22G01101 [Tripterygium wilfordii]